MTLPGLPGGDPYANPNPGAAFRAEMRASFAKHTGITDGPGPAIDLDALKGLSAVVKAAQERLDREHGPLLYGLPVVHASWMPPESVLIVTADLKGIRELAALTGGRTVVYNRIGRDGNPSKLDRALYPVPLYTTRCLGMLEAARDRRRRRKGIR